MTFILGIIAKILAFAFIVCIVLGFLGFLIYCYELMKEDWQNASKSSKKKKETNTVNFTISFKN
jgi:hypothetical protein